MRKTRSPKPGSAPDGAGGDDMEYSVSPAKGGKAAVYQGGRKVREFLAESDA
ncbi:hypothetical protein FACS189444_4990 [Spirochaetia bacterium]|nr:hypothetical protein FACS189444_4990 [Spirochaetia bacterium]